MIFMSAWLWVNDGASLKDGPPASETRCKKICEGSKKEELQTFPIWCSYGLHGV